MSDSHMPICIPLEPPNDFAALVERERAALLDALRSIGSADWLKPTACPGWSVHDLVLHVLGSDIGVISRQRDSYDGTPGPKSHSEVAFETFLDDLNSQWVIANRRMSPDMAIALLRDTGEQLAELYRHADASMADARVSWASTERLPRWFDHARELTERWVHHQQILEAVGASPWMEPEMTSVVIDTFGWAYPYRLGHLVRPEGTTAGVDISGEVERRWRWASTGSGWVAVEGEADTVLTMDTRTAWRLLTNGLHPDDWPVAAPAGDTAIARTLVRTRAILATPNG